MILICSHVGFGDLLMNLSDFKRNSTIEKSLQKINMVFLCYFCTEIPGQNSFSADIFNCGFKSFAAHFRTNYALNLAREIFCLI